MWLQFIMFNIFLVNGLKYVVVLTIAQLPGDVVLLASAVLQEAEGGGGVPGVVWISVQRVEPQDQVQASTVGKVVQFV